MKIYQETQTDEKSRGKGWAEPRANPGALPGALPGAEFNTQTRSSQACMCSVNLQDSRRQLFRLPLRPVSYTLQVWIWRALEPTWDLGLGHWRYSPVSRESSIQDDTTSTQGAKVRPSQGSAGPEFPPDLSLDSLQVLTGDQAHHHLIPTSLRQE